jgi:hypothetical protein
MTLAVSDRSGCPRIQPPTGQRLAPETIDCDLGLRSTPGVRELNPPMREISYGLGSSSSLTSDLSEN